MVGLLIALGDQLPIQALVYVVISIQLFVHGGVPITSWLYSTTFNLSNKPRPRNMTARSLYIFDHKNNSVGLQHPALHLLVPPTLHSLERMKLNMEISVAALSLTSTHIVRAAS